MSVSAGAARWDGLDAAAIAALTGAPLVELHDTLPSTLDLTHQLGERGEPSGALVLADEQTAGRGRAGRPWHSARGAGIWLAMLLRPATAPLGGALAIRAGLAVCDAVAAAAAGLAPRLKWPNDVMVLGRKAGGILCEARWSGERLGWVAVGVGLNLRGPPAGAPETRAIGLADVAPALTRAAVLAALGPRLAALAQAPPALEPAERADFLARAWSGPGEPAPAGLEPDGALLVCRADGSLDRRTAPA